MGKVVKLDTATTDRSAGASGRRRRQQSKSALVLGGGGFTGAVYEIGALRALDLLSINRTVNEFSVYVGTSAGSFVAAAVANGVTPEEMMRVIVQQVPTPFPDASVNSLLRPNYTEFVAKGLLLPWDLLRLLRTLARDLGQITAVDVVVGLAETLPSGLYNTATASSATSARSSRTPTGPTTSGCSPTSSTSQRPTSTRASGSCSVPRIGTTSRSRRRSAPRARCR